MPKPRTPAPVFQLKITLLGIKPPVWRRVLVPADIRLSQLHRVIQIAMGWADSHLHAFELGEARYLDASYDPGFVADMGGIDERSVRLDQLLRAPRSRMGYEYDFGDSWEHEIKLEQILLAEPGSVYPRCLKGARACPPDDVGGVWGYADFLEAVANPRHPKHAEMREWIGGDFKPEAFDPEDTNAVLARLSRRRR